MTEAAPKVSSVNVSGALRTFHFAGQAVATGFYKSATSGIVRAHKLGLEGDAQGDLTVHGGPEKAVYFYPREHYAIWEALLGSGRLSPGSFGENITSVGLLEKDLNIGDILRIGSAVLQVVQPRSPCYKLQLRFERPDMTALFYRQGKPGWYASVLEEGEFATGDNILLLDRGPDDMTVADIWLYSTKQELDRSTVERVRRHPLLPDFWKERIGHHVR